MSDFYTRETSGNLNYILEQVLHLIVAAYASGEDFTLALRVNRDLKTMAVGLLDNEQSVDDYLEGSDERVRESQIRRLENLLDDDE